MPARPKSITVHPNAAQGIAHLRVLAPPRTFAAVSAELTAILGEAPIKDPAGAHVWLLDLLQLGGIAKDLKLHPRVLLCEPDASDEGEVLFVESHGAGLYEVGVQVDEDRGGKGGSSETPFGRVAWIPV